MPFFNFLFFSLNAAPKAASMLKNSPNCPLEAPCLS